MAHSIVVRDSGIAQLNLRLLRAASLTDRLRAVANDNVTRSQLKQGHVLYDEWRTQTPFAGDVLADSEGLYGCTEYDLVRALAAPPEVLRAVVEGSSWRDEFLQAFMSLAETRREPREDDGPLHPLLAAVAPLLARFRMRINRRARSLMRQNPRHPFGRIDVAELFIAHLEQRLIYLLVPSLVGELTSFRDTLTGGTPEARFHDFASNLNHPAWRLGFFSRYPVLARYGATLTQLTADAGIEFVTRLAGDWPLIQDCFGFFDDDTLETVAAAGDPHCGARAVLMLGFASGGKLVYKPRPVTSAQAFQELLGWINGRDRSFSARTIRVLPRGAYGWVEHVSTESCSTSEAHHFYRQQGRLLSLLHAISSTDFHSENLLAAGGQPVLVDLETVFSPAGEPAVRDASGEPGRLVPAFAVESLRRIGLLPITSYARDGSRGVDLSGLGGGDRQFSPLKHLIVVEGGSDQMRLELKEVEIQASGNLPRLKTGETLVSHEFSQDVLSGFQEMSSFIMSHRADLVEADGPLAKFEATPIRSVLRATAQYGLLLESLRNPQLLEDGFRVDFQIDRFLSSGEPWNQLAAIRTAERRDIWLGDTPYFQTVPASRDIWTTQGTRIDHVFRESGSEISRRRVSELDSRRIRALLWEASASFECARAGALSRAGVSTISRVRFHKRRQYNLAPDLQDIALDEACALGQRIIDLRIERNGYPTWLAIEDTHHETQVSHMGPELYSGVGGVVLFLAYLAHVAHDRKFRTHAANALQTTRRLIDEMEDNWSVGAFNGLSGYVYVLLHLAALWNDATLVEDAARYVGRLSPLVGSDESHDVLTGVAGAIPVLLTLQRCSPKSGALRVAELCGNRLLAAAKRQRIGFAWDTLPNRSATPLTGFGHGAAGIAWSLMLLFVATGQRKFERMALEGMAYERSIFERYGGWPDLRGPDGGYGDHPRPASPTWCNGAVGIGLARCRLFQVARDDELRREIDRAVDSTCETGFGYNHALCHGDLGNLELLAEASTALKRGKLNELYMERAQNLLLDIQRGYKTGVSCGVDSFDLMRGTSGIGFGLLRVAARREVPSVLLLDPPPRLARS